VFHHAKLAQIEWGPAALSILLPFATTYTACVNLDFPLLFHVKNKYRNRLNPSNNVHVVLSNCVPGYERMISEKHKQKSH